MKMVCCLEEDGERPEELVRDEGGATIDFDEIMDHGASGTTQASV